MMEIKSDDFLWYMFTEPDDKLTNVLFELAGLAVGGLKDKFISGYYYHTRIGYLKYYERYFRLTIKMGLDEQMWPKVDRIQIDELNEEDYNEGRKRQDDKGGDRVTEL
jgi:hypothetical protein